MNYAIWAYGAIGIFAYVWYAPRYLRRRNLKPRNVGWIVIDLLSSDLLGVLILLVALAVWPLAVPLWIWNELRAKKLKEEDLAFRRREREGRERDSYYERSLDEKLEILARKVEAGRPNLPPPAQPPQARANERNQRPIK